jgi:hypothetical protein
MNRVLPGIAEPPAAIVVGVLRSIYAFLKTTFWLGGWSFVRAPMSLVAVWFLLIAALLLTSRARPRSPNTIPHVGGLLVAVAGIALFLTAHRRYWGQWGGVAGWYAWGWSPWLALAWNDCFRTSRRAAEVLLPATAAFVVVANWIYFREILGLYRY